MNGWIKLEKDLLTDPRLVRMAQRIVCNGEPLPGVMLVLGGLAYLWILADTHISDEDILPLGVDEINKLLSMPGFCELLPADWLQVIDANHVKLPRYHEHNGTIAKERALNARRVANHRAKRNAKALQGGNGPSLPDQDQDQDLKKKNSKKKIAARLPDDWRASEADILHATNLGLPPLKTVEAFVDYWRAAAGANAVKHDWSAAFRTWCRRSIAMAPLSPLKRDDGAAWAEAKARAAAIGFRAPGNLESVGAYMTSVKLAETRVPTGTLARLEAGRGNH